MELGSDAVEDFVRNVKVRNADERDVMRRMIFVDEPIRTDVVGEGNVVYEGLVLMVVAGDDCDVVSVAIGMLLTDEFTEVDEGILIVAC